MSSIYDHFVLCLTSLPTTTVKSTFFGGSDAARSVQRKFPPSRVGLLNGVNRYGWHRSWLTGKEKPHVCPSRRNLPEDRKEGRVSQGCAHRCASDPEEAARLS